MVSKQKVLCNLFFVEFLYSSMLVLNSAFEELTWNLLEIACALQIN
jgi:hypothetical protein